MPVDRDALTAALAAKGFRVRQTHHEFYYLFVDGKQQAVYTKVSHGSKYKTLGDDLVTAVARQMKLTKPQLTQFVDCTLSEAAYVQGLRARGVLPPVVPVQPAQTAPAKTTKTRKRRR